MSEYLKPLDDRFASIFFAPDGSRKPLRGGRLALPGGTSLVWIAMLSPSLRRGEPEQPVIVGTWKMGKNTSASIALRSLSTYWHQRVTGELVKTPPSFDPYAASKVYHLGLGMTATYVDADTADHDPYMSPRQVVVRDEASHTIYNNSGRDTVVHVGSLAPCTTLWSRHSEAAAMRELVEALIAQALDDPGTIQNP